MGILKKKGEERKKRFILSIDGGGMRGIIPAYILQKLNSRLRELGDERPLYSHFDMIAGTSTGALIAAALSIPTEGTLFPEERIQPYPVFEEITQKRLFFHRTERILRGTLLPSSDPGSFVDFYTENGRKIFPQKGMSALIAPIFSDKYSGAEYESFLRKLYGTRTMGELMVPTVLVSYSTNLGTIFPITSWRHKDYAIWEGSRASTAAPLYFPEFVMNRNGRRIHLIDGGVAANNPSLIAYSLSRTLYGDAEYHILSLSTGTPLYKTAESQNQGGITGWGGQISKVFQNAQSELSDKVMNAIPGVSYTRIWAPVLDRKIKLDETGKESINTLIKAADDMYREKTNELMLWAEALSQHPVPETARIREMTESPRLSEEEGT